MRVAFLNVGSLHDSVEAVAAFFISSKLDILFLTETRVLSTSTNVLNQRIAISAFKKWHKSAGSAASHCTVALSLLCLADAYAAGPSQNLARGTCVIFNKQKFSITQLPGPPASLAPQSPNFYQHVQWISASPVSVAADTRPICIGAVYWPPITSALSADANRCNDMTFVSDLTRSAHHFSSSFGQRLLLGGDFNAHLAGVGDSRASMLADNFGALLRLGNSLPLEPTFVTGRQSGPRYLRASAVSKTTVDYIFYAPGLQLDDFTIHSGDLDKEHLPISCIIWPALPPDPTCQSSPLPAQDAASLMRWQPPPGLSEELPTSDMLDALLSAELFPALTPDGLSTFAASCRASATTPVDADRVWDQAQTLLHSVLPALGYKQVPRIPEIKPLKSYWYSDREVGRMHARLKVLKHYMGFSPPPSNMVAVRERYTWLRAEHRRRLHAAKRGWFWNRVRAFEAMYKPVVRKFWSQFNCDAGRQPIVQLPALTRDGIPLPAGPVTVECLADNFQANSVSQPVPPSSAPPDLERRPPAGWALPVGSRVHVDWNCLTYDCNSDELLRLVMKLNFNSAPGLDGIPAVFTKQLLGYEPLREFMVVVFNTFLRLGSVPAEWTTGLWRAIPKFSDARKFDVKQQRPISIMSTVEKIFESLLNNRLSSWLQRKKLLVPTQFGFRDRTGVLHHYFSLNEAVVWRSTHGLSTWIAFIDVCKAFDIVDHQCLFWKMRLLGIDTHFIRIVQSLLGRMRRRVLHGRHVSSLREIFAGVSQGSTLGPLLYSIFINDMVEFFSSKGFNLDVGLAVGLLNTLLYADDTTLLAENPPRLQEMLLLLEVYSVTWHWQINVPKSHIMGILPCVSGSLTPPVSTPVAASAQQTFRIYGSPLDVVTEFRNLGIEFTMGPDRWLTFLSRSLLSARGASFFISRFVQSGMLLSPRIVHYLSQSLVHSICEYGAQIWGPYLCSQAGLRKHLTAIDTLKFSVLRSSLGLHRYYPSLPRKSYWHPTSSFLLRADMGVAPMRHRCAELLFAFWNTSLAFNRDYFTVTFRQRWADFHVLEPATSSPDSWFPHARALFVAFGLSSYFDEGRQIEYSRLCRALISHGTSYELAQCQRRSAHPDVRIASSGLSNSRVSRLLHLSPVIEHLQRKALHQLDKMDAEKRDSVLLHESAISIYNCGLPLYLQLWSRSPTHPRLIRRFLTIRSGYLPRLCRNCKHFYPTLHHLLISCPSNFLKGARKTLRDDLRVLLELDTIPPPLRSQLQALLPGLLGRIEFLLLDWDMQDFWDLYRPLATMETPEWPRLMGRVLRFHDAVYMNHRSTFRSFPLKEQPDGQQQQGPPSGSASPAPDDSSDDSADESS
jgi:hypothetical protein